MNQGEEYHIQIILNLPEELSYGERMVLFETGGKKIVETYVKLRREDPTFPSIEVAATGPYGDPSRSEEALLTHLKKWSRVAGLSFSAFLLYESWSSGNMYTVNGDDVKVDDSFFRGKDFSYNYGGLEYFFCAEMSPGSLSSKNSISHFFDGIEEKYFVSNNYETEGISQMSLEGISP